ncbi:MAG TPA: alcohol dehydrogenase catalytic domain-containing protein [Planctomycetota bacterium]|nr:alcohol dehydrogenase catalytic domain-containing protein [Planctomycetota bacterium]
MKAAVYHGPRDVRIETVPTPKAEAGELVLKILRCAVCGTDKRIFTHGQKNVVPPTTTGHEMVGEVHEIGTGVKGFKKGQRVIAAAVIGCGKCLYCRRGKSNLCDDFTALGYQYPGGFAEYMKVPARAVEAGNVMPIPDGISPDRAALIEPLTCVLNGQEFLNAQKGDRAVVIGAGPIGLMHAGVLKAHGCSPIVVADVSDERLAYVREFGLGIPVNTSGGDAVDKILKAAGGEPFDIAITACSVKAAQPDALKLVRKGARVSFFAGIPKDDPVVPIDTNHLHYNEISVFGAFGSDLRHYRKGIEMIARGDLPWDRFITHKFKLDRIHDAFKVMEAGQGIKTVIDCE